MIFTAIEFLFQLFLTISFFQWSGRDEKCIFIEKYLNGYTELESAWMKDIYLGFNGEGRFLDPSRYRQRRTCFQYLKILDENDFDKFQEPNYRPNVNISHRQRHPSHRKLNRRLEGVR